MMRLIIYTLFMSAFISCGDDSCDTMDYEGIWVGNLTCTGEEPQPISVTIISQQENMLMISDEHGENFQGVYTECEFEVPDKTVTVFGFEVTTGGTGILDGSVLSLTISSNPFGNEINCTYSLTKTE